MDASRITYVPDARRCFTLIELLCVASIIAVLAALLLPALHDARAQVRQVACSNSLRHMALANVAYMTDNNTFSVHGIDMGYANWGRTGYGRSFYPTYIFDDDWYDAKPGIPGRNPDSNGAQNICHIGLLMVGDYIDDDYRILACAQADFREKTPYHWAAKSYTRESTASSRNSAKRCIETTWWRQDSYSGNPSYAYLGTTYVVRGPRFRVYEVEPSRFALFADHEQAAQTLIPEVPVGRSPLPGWGRVHKGGINTAYLDGHVRLVPDKDRSITYWTHYTRFYGNGWALLHGAYDH